MEYDQLRRGCIEEGLRHAIGRGELSLVWQPVVDGASGETVGAEALLRWTNAALGSVSPCEFIPVAEEAGLIGGIGDWVMSEACEQTAQWRGILPPEFEIAVNVSPHQLDERFTQHVARCLERNGLPSSTLQLEITESTVLPDTACVASTMGALAARGIELMIDDFGTGFSSLTSLNRFAWAGFKIDRGFVAGLPHERGSVAITDALVRMARSLDMKVTAEGVETREQADYLREAGCNRLQGYLFDRPLHAEDFIDRYMKARTKSD